MTKQKPQQPVDGLLVYLVALVAAAATELLFAAIGLRGLSLSWPLNFVQLGVFMSNSR